MPQYLLLIVDDPTGEWASPEAPVEQSASAAPPAPSSP